MSAGQARCQALAGCLAVVLLACSSPPRPALPPVPEIRTEDFLPSVKARVEEAKAALERAPEDSEANGRLAMLLHAHEHLAAAETLYRRAHRLAPDSFEWCYYLGLVEARAGKLSEAAQTFRAALALRPSYQPARLQLADALMAGGDREEAARLYREVLRELPESPQAHYGLGRVAAAKRDPEGAIGHFEKALEMYPRYAAARYALGLALRQNGQPARAERELAAYEADKMSGPPSGDELLRAVRGLNTGPLELISRGRDLERQGKLREAVDLHLQALELDARFEQAHVNLISLYGRLGDAGAAEKHYREVVAANPNLAESHYNYGVLLFEAGREQEARQAFERALAINPQYAEAHNNLGYLLMTRQRLAEAESHFRKALENNPNHRLANFHLARILLHRGDTQGAIGLLSRTLTPEDANTPGFLFGLAAAHARLPGAENRAAALRYAREAHAMALKYDQPQLAANIARDLAKLERAAKTP